MSFETDLLINWIPVCEMSRRRKIIRLIRDATDRQDALIALRMEMTNDWRRDYLLIPVVRENGLSDYERVHFERVDWGKLTDLCWNRWREHKRKTAILLHYRSGRFDRSIYGTAVDHVLVVSTDPDEVYFQRYLERRNLYESGSFEIQANEVNAVFRRLQKLTHFEQRRGYQPILVFARIGNRYYDPLACDRPRYRMEYES